MDLDSIKVTSPDFKNGTVLKHGSPYLCSRDGGVDKMPQLVWDTNVPGVKSWFICCVDPDSVNGLWIHASGFLGEDKQVQFVKNSWGNAAYGGPCPPPGTGVHRYFFMVMALDIVWPTSEDITPLINTKSTHILKIGTIMFRYGVSEQ